MLNDSDATSSSFQSSQDGDVIDMSTDASQVEVEAELVGEINEVCLQTTEQKEVLRQMDELMKSIATEKEPDSIDLFCDSLKEDMRQVPPANILICKAQILNVITENIVRGRT